MIQSAAGLVYMPQCAHLQAYMSSLIGPVGDILVCDIEKIQRRTQWAIGVSTGWRGRAVGIPSLVAHCRLHFIDGAVNFTNGAVPFADESRAVIRLQQFTRLPEVGEGMKVVGTLSQRRCSQCKEQKSQQPEACRGE